MKERKKRNDFILIGIIAALAAAYFLYRFFAPGEAGGQVLVTVHEKKYAVLPLDKDTELVIEGPSGGRNVLKIEDGKAYMLDASCPDKRCINQGSINKQKEMIVCLPNQVVVSVNKASASDEEGLDSIVQ